MPREADIWELRAYGRRLLRARDEADLSQREVGEAISCTQGFISRVEKGQMMLRAIDYPVVADLLGVSVGVLLGPFTAEERAAMVADLASMEEDRQREGYADPSMEDWRF